MCITIIVIFLLLFAKQTDESFIRVSYFFIVLTLFLFRHFLSLVDFWWLCPLDLVVYLWMNLRRSGNLSSPQRHKSWKHFLFKLETNCKWHPNNPLHFQLTSPRGYLTNTFFSLQKAKKVMEEKTTIEIESKQRSIIKLARPSNIALS